VPFEEWDRLSRIEDERKSLAPLRRGGSAWDALMHSLEQLTYERAEELYEYRISPQPSHGDADS
jgi:hypothetical protein